MARLIMRRGPDPGKVFHLDKDVHKIGRGRKNDFIIHDNEVSREHCQLIRKGGFYELVDLDSSNGTFVNGQRVADEGWLLKTDCIVEIGDSITFEYLTDTSILENNEEKGPVIHPYLIVTVASHPEKPEVYPLHGEVIEVGRELSATIVVQEPEISRRHLRLRYTELGYMAEDAGSTNGTFLNNERLVVSKLLRVNDVLQMGTTVRLLYTDDPSKYLANMKTHILAEDDDTVTKRSIDTSAILTRVNRPTETSEITGGVQPGSLIGHIFVAYAPVEWQAVVAPLYAYLRERKLPVWVDKDFNRKSNNWETSLDQILSECGLLLVVLSKSALNTDYVKRAWAYFHTRHKPIIVMRYQNAEAPPGALRGVPVIEYDPANASQVYLEILSEITRLRP